jgi:succinate dehydrogenase hydrophobic anchor subunit
MVILINSVKIEKMKKINLTFVLFLISLVFFLLFSLAPSYVDDQGLLHEPFYLILLGYACLFLGVLSLIIGILKKQ